MNVPLKIGKIISKSQYLVCYCKLSSIVSWFSILLFLIIIYCVLFGVLCMILNITLNTTQKDLFKLSSKHFILTYFKFQNVKEG